MTELPSTPPQRSRIDVATHAFYPVASSQDNARRRVTSFIRSNEAAFRRAVRDAIKKSTLTKSEQALVQVLANLWFHHKAKGAMHPGREKIARQAGVSVKTVTRTMTKLKAAGCLVVVSHENGGGAATRFRLKPLELMVFCGARLPSWAVGDDLTRLPAQDGSLPSAEMSRIAEDKMSHGLTDVGKGPSDVKRAGCPGAHHGGRRSCLTVSSPAR